MPTSTLLFALLLLISFSVAFSGFPTAYELLESYDFPQGLLPEGVESYLLQSDGSFDVYFGWECEFKVQDSYLLRYKRRISGTLEAGRLKDLKGVSVRFLFVWLGITEVVRMDDELRFYVGPISASFPVTSFVDCPMCRCGFDCGTAELPA